jgi:hypothetical protein
MLKVRSGQERLFACDALCHHRAYGTVTFCVNSRRRNRGELTLCTIGTCFPSTNLVERRGRVLGFLAFKRLYIYILSILPSKGIDILLDLDTTG